jgi:hypothetical protein
MDSKPTAPVEKECAVSDSIVEAMRLVNEMTTAERDEFWTALGNRFGVENLERQLSRAVNETRMHADGPTAENG